MISGYKMSFILLHVSWVLYVVPAYAVSNQALIDVILKMEEMYNAIVYEVDVKGGRGEYIYEIETLRNNEFYESVIDVRSGKILEDGKENHHFWKPLSDEEKEKVASSVISLGHAIKLVENKNSSLIQEVTFKISNDKSFYHVVCVNGDRYQVDAVMGHVSQL